MKSYINLFVALVVIFTNSSCEEDFDTSTVIGRWKLIETLADPGDGSGEYEKYEGNQIATFYSDSSVVFTEGFCFSQGGVDGKEARIQGNTINWSDCNLTMEFELKSDLLYFYPPCIEPCGYKFEKIAD